MKPAEPPLTDLELTGSRRAARLVAIALVVIAAAVVGLGRIVSDDLALVSVVVLLFAGPLLIAVELIAAVTEGAQRRRDARAAFPTARVVRAA